jgi:hypothetical protein
VSPEEQANLPREIASKEIELLGVKITVVVLDNGMRLIAEDGLFRLLEAMGMGELTEDKAEELARAIHGVE